MLDRARSRLGVRAELLQAEISSFSFRERFERIIAPFNTLYTLPEAALIACLKQARDHLAPGGRLIFDLYTLDSEPLPEEWLDWFFLGSLTDGPRQIKTWEREEETEWGARLSYRHQILEEGSVRELEYSIKHYRLPPVRWLEIFETLGLRMRHCFGDFDGSSFGRESSHFIPVLESSDLDWAPTASF